MRLSPFATAQGVYTDESPAEHLEIFKMIKGAVPDLGYLHVVEPRGDPVSLSSRGLCMEPRELRRAGKVQSAHWGKVVEPEAKLSQRCEGVTRGTSLTIQGKLAGWANEFAAHDVKETLEPYREVLQGTGIQFLSAGGYTPELAKETAEKYGGGVVFGRLFISSESLSY